MYNSPIYHQTNMSRLHLDVILERGGAGVRGSFGGLLGNVAVSLSGRQSCRCPSYLFISQIINVYKEPLIALFTNDLWVL